MAAEAPESKEVSDFRFRQLRKLKLTKGNEDVPVNATNIVATCSKYGLLFIGVNDGFKVLKLENVLDLNEDKENIRSHAENYSCQKILCEAPVLLAISADDLTLAVCVTRNSNIVADMYDLRAFGDPDASPVPFLNVQLCTHGAQLTAFLWNPVVVEMYVYVLSDGSVHVHELADTLLKIVASQVTVNATAVCWSPKGKQLVVGKTNGSFAQFKPTLQEVKSFAPPKLDENSISVTSICWISTTLFAVLYAPEDNKNDVPYLVFVSTPKGSPVLYTNYNDVCFGSGSQNESRYLMHYESEWGILICASTNSPDVAVIGINKTNPSVWEQWKLDEGAEAMLPTDKTGESYPLGLGVMYCAQRKIVISDNESYSAMPVIFILSSKGLLVSFHMHNSSPLAANLVYPSEAISKDGERRRKDPPPTNTVLSPHNFTSAKSPPAVANPLQPQMDSSNQTPISQNSMFSMSALKQNSTNQSPKLGANSTLTFPQSNQFQSFSSLTATQQVAHSFVTPPPQSFPPLQMSMFQNIPPPPPPALTPPAHPPTPSPFYASPPQLLPSPGFLTSPENSEKIHKKPSRESSLSVITPVATSGESGSMRPVAVAQRHLVSSTKKLETKTEKTSTYTSAIFEEINSMNAEIEELRTTLGQTFHIGTKEEMTCLKQSSMSSEEFQTNMKNTMQSLNSDIHGLKNVLLESFVMVEDGNSRERRKNDNSYISMLKDRALDPMTAKRMQKIDQNYQYLSAQLQEVHDKLNHNYMEYEEKKKENQRLRHPIPSAEAIYRAIVHNQNTIFNLRSKTDILAKRTNQRKHQKFSRRYGQYTESVDIRDISKLADSLLQAEVSPQKNENPATRMAKKLSPDKQAVLSEFLANRTISTIKPTVVYSPSQSRLLSRSQLYSKDSNQAKPKAEPGFIAREQTTREANPGPTSLALQNKASAFEKTPLFGSMSQNLQMNSSVNKSILSTQLQERPLKPENTFSAITSQSLSFKTTSENSSIPHSIVVPVTKAAVPQNTSQPYILSPQAHPQVSGYFQNMTYSTPLNTGIAPKTTSFSQAHAFSFIQARDDAQPSYTKISEAFYEDITPTDTPPYSEEDYSGEASHISEDEFNEYNQSLVSQLSLEQLNERQSLNEKVLFEVSINKDGEAVAHPVTSTSQDFQSDLQEPYSSTGNIHGSLFKDFSDVQATDDEIAVRVTKSAEIPLPTYSQSISAKESSKQQTSGSMAVSSPTITTVKSVTSEGKTAVNLPASKSGEKTASKKNEVSSSYLSFGQSSGSLFGEKSLFGNSDSSNSKPLFGQFAVSSNATSFFGPKTTSSGTTPATSSVFGQKLGTTSIFGQVSTTKADSPGLDLSIKQATTTAAESSSSVSLFSQPDPNVSVSRPVLESVSSSDNKPVSSTGSLIFTKAESDVEPAATTSSDIPQSTSYNLSDQVITSTPNDESWNKHIEDDVRIATLEAQATTIAASASMSQSTTILTSDSSVPAVAVTSPSVPVSQETPVSISTLTVSSLEPVTTSSIAATESSVQPTTTLSTTANDQPHTTTDAAPVATPSLLFGQVANSTSTVSPTLFGQSTSTTASVFGSSATNSLFSQQASTTTASVFGQPVTTASVFGQPTSTTTASVFGQPTSTTTASVFGQPTSTTTASVFGQPTSTTTASVFGQAASTTAEATSTAPSLFGAASSSAATPSLFGQKPSEGTSSFFGQSAAATTQSSFFSKPAADTPLFGQSNSFGQPQSQTLTTSSGPFGQGSFFSQTPIGGTSSLFGSGSAGSEGGSTFGAQSAAAGFSFGKSTFGQSSGTFGLAKSVFGASSTFGQPPASAPFGQSQGGGVVFGQGSFFSGLGGKPSSENASKNVFGSGALGKPGGDSGIFGSEGASTFGSKPAGAFSGGSFSGGGGAVGETGFGSFQQSPQKTGGFGTAPAFGSSPAFGSPPAFGPMAASTSPIGGSVFGSQQSASFSNFASASSPTFGSLATQSPPSFGAAQNQAPPFGQQPQQQQGSLFGSAPVFGASSFGGQPQSNFGNPGSPPGNASAFTQWRN